MSAFLDSRGILIESGASVHIITRSGHNPCHFSYLWRVESRWSGGLYMTPRPYQMLPDIRLTDDISRFLVVLQEREAFVPENHPEIWQAFLDNGWGIHSGFLPQKEEDIWMGAPRFELGICNAYNNIRDTYQMGAVQPNTEIYAGGLTEHEFAARAWSFYLNQAIGINRAVQNLYS